MTITAMTTDMNVTMKTLVLAVNMVLSTTAGCSSVLEQVVPVSDESGASLEGIPEVKVYEFAMVEWGMGGGRGAKM